MSYNSVYGRGRNRTEGVPISEIISIFVPYGHVEKASEYWLQLTKLARSQLSAYSIPTNMIFGSLRRLRSVYLPENQVEVFRRRLFPRLPWRNELPEEVRLKYETSAQRPTQSIQGRRRR